MAAPSIPTLVSAAVKGLPVVRAPVLPTPSTADGSGPPPAGGGGSSTPHLDTDAFFTWGTATEFRSGHVTAGWEVQHKNGAAWDPKLRVTSAGAEVVGDLGVSGGVTAATLAGSGSGITALAAGNITSGTLADARLSANVGLLDRAQSWTAENSFGDGLLQVGGAAPFGSTVLGTLATGVRAVNFPAEAGTLLLTNGSGAALTALNASNISSGTLADARLSSNVPLKDAANTFTLDNVFSGKIGIGGSPTAPLHIKAAAAAGPYYSQLAIEPLADNSDASVYLKTTRGTDREWFFGAGTGGAGDSGKFRIFDITANLDRLNIDHSGYVVLGGTAASGPLHIKHNAPGAPFYSQIIVEPPSANVDASMSLKTTHGAGRHWYIAAGTSALSDVTGFRITDLTAGAQRFGIDGTGVVTCYGPVVVGGLVTWSAGAAITAGSYQVGRDNAGTNRMVANVPTGASFAWSINGIDAMQLSAAGGLSAGAATFDSIDLSNGDISNVGTITAVNALPASDNTGSVGTAALRWAQVRAADIIAGDLSWDDEACPACGGAFAVGDDVVWRVHRTSLDEQKKPISHGIPIHLHCSENKEN